MERSTAGRATRTKRRSAAEVGIPERKLAAAQASPQKLARRIGLHHGRREVAEVRIQRESSARPLLDRNGVRSAHSVIERVVAV